MSGPGTAGILVGAAGAPFAILIDAVTYLVPAVTLLSVGRTKPVPQPSADPRKSLRAQIGHGLRLSVSNTYLRALGTEAAVCNLVNQMPWAVLILHLISVNLSPTAPLRRRGQPHATRQRRQTTSP